MISEKDKEIIIHYAKKYNIAKVFLFGSSLGDYNAANDIDLAVLGIKPEVFFKFYGELLRNLSKPVDLVDLSKKSLFNEIIEEKGVKIYG
jgi:predicted nucleotidyltransferase